MAGQGAFAPPGLPGGAGRARGEGDGYRGREWGRGERRRKGNKKKVDKREKKDEGSER